MLHGMCRTAGLGPSCTGIAAPNGADGMQVAFLERKKPDRANASKKFKWTSITVATAKAAFVCA
jgi:hypothetical protein